MLSALHLAAKLLVALPREFTAPETTEGRQGYIHPSRIDGSVERTTITLILRDHELAGLEEKGQRLRGHPLRHPQPVPQHGYWLKKDMTPVDLAYDAMRAIGLEPISPAIRGGTDGSRLTERGLPTPNLFCGGHNAHGPLEWVAVQDMELAVQACVELAKVWEQKGVGYKGYQPKARQRKAKA
jgi:tripeptide aminopeptidase